DRLRNREESGVDRVASVTRRGLKRRHPDGRTVRRAGSDERAAAPYRERGHRVDDGELARRDRVANEEVIRLAGGGGPGERRPRDLDGAREYPGRLRRCEYEAREDRQHEDEGARPEAAAERTLSHRPSSDREPATESPPPG